MLIIKLDLLQVARGKTNSQHRQRPSTDICFFNDLWPRQGGWLMLHSRRCVCAHMHTHLYAHSINRVLNRLKAMTTNSPRVSPEVLWAGFLRETIVCLWPPVYNHTWPCCHMCATVTVRNFILCMTEEHLWNISHPIVKLNWSWWIEGLLIVTEKIM